MAAYARLRSRAASRALAARWLLLFAVAAGAARPSPSAAALCLPGVSIAAALVLALGSREAGHAASLVLDDMVAAQEALPQAATRHARQITSVAARRRLAQMLRRLVLRSVDRRAAAYEIFDVAAVRRQRGQLLELAARLEAGAAAPRGCALLRQLLLQPWRSSLYGSGAAPGRLAQELAAIQSALGPLSLADR